jgi:hypothetical protein
MTWSWTNHFRTDLAWWGFAIGVYSETLSLIPSFGA